LAIKLFSRIQGDTIRVGIFDDFVVDVEDIFEGLIDFKK
jgi:hypothetical protein